MAPLLERPNFLFINTDQQRWDTLGCYGSTVAKTPNIDRLAEEGLRFDRCYCSNPVCMPARASWFTGQYPSHNGCWNNGAVLPPDADMIQTRLRAAGYHAALIGKIHLDNVWERCEPHPLYGFDFIHECEGDPYCRDEYFRWLDGQGLFGPYKEQFDREGHRDGYTRDLPEEKHMNNWIAGHVEEYFAARQQDGKPFFLSVGFFDPHHPFDPVEPYASMFRDEDMPMPIYAEAEEAAMPPLARKRREQLKEFCTDPDGIRRTIAAYHATVAHVDAMVGRIMAALRAAGHEENTVVIFTSDHGEMLGDHGILWKGPIFYEGAIRVPLIYRLPEACGLRGVDTGFASHVDLAATVSELAGVAGPRLQQGTPLIGRDGTVRPQGGPDGAVCEWRGDALHMGDLDAPALPIMRAYVTDRWKYVHYDGLEAGELYDLEADPQEVRNLYTVPEHAEQVSQMQRRLLNFTLQAEPTLRRTNLF